MGFESERGGVIPTEFESERGGVIPTGFESARAQPLERAVPGLNLHRLPPVCTIPYRFLNTAGLTRGIDWHAGA